MDAVHPDRVRYRVERGDTHATEILSSDGVSEVGDGENSAKRYNVCCVYRRSRTALSI